MKNYNIFYSWLASKMPNSLMIAVIFAAYARINTKPILIIDLVKGLEK